MESEEREKEMSKYRWLRQFLTDERNAYLYPNITVMVLGLALITIGLEDAKIRLSVLGFLSFVELLLTFAGAPFRWFWEKKVEAR